MIARTGCPVLLYSYHSYQGRPLLGRTGKPTGAGFRLTVKSPLCASRAYADEPDQTKFSEPASKRRMRNRYFALLGRHSLQPTHVPKDYL